MSRDWLDLAMRKAASGGAHELWARLVVLETALSRLETAASAAPDLALVRAGLSLGLATSELESAAGRGDEPVALINLGEFPVDLGVARGHIAEALAEVASRMDRSIWAGGGSVRALAAGARALAHVRDAEAVLRSSP